MEIHLCQIRCECMLTIHNARAGITQSRALGIISYQTRESQVATSYIAHQLDALVHIEMGIGSRFYIVSSKGMPQEVRCLAAHLNALMQGEVGFGGRLLALFGSLSAVAHPRLLKRCHIILCCALCRPLHCDNPSSYINCLIHN